MKLADLSDNHQLRDLHRALKFVSQFDLALDIGAHRGILTAAMCDQFKSVHAFEPTKLADRIDPRAKVLRVAMGPSVGFCSLQPGEQNNGQTYVVKGEDTPMMALDGLGLMPNFIKIDVEGYEIPVIHGAKQTILNARPVIMFEDNGLCERYGYALNDCARLLQSWGMKEVAVLSRWQRGADYVYTF